MILGRWTTGHRGPRLRLSGILSKAFLVPAACRYRAVATVNHGQRRPAARGFAGRRDLRQRGGLTRFCVNRWSRPCVMFLAP